MAFVAPSSYDTLSYDPKHELHLIELIQFAIMSPEEIRWRSVVEVTSSETYSNGQPVPKGLFDRRMGSLDVSTLCDTCNQLSTLCQGHSGHIDLALPVFNAKHMDVVKKILKAVCYNCSALLANVALPEVRRTIFEKSGPRRLEAAVAKANSNKGVCMTCGKKQPDKYTKPADDGWVLTAVIPTQLGGQGGQGGQAHGAEVGGSSDAIDAPSEADAGADAGADTGADAGADTGADAGADAVEETDTVEGEVSEVAVAAEDATRIFEAGDVRAILARMTDATCEALGFNVKACRPEWLIQTVQLVPSPIMRPSTQNDSKQRSDDDLTSILGEIVKHNNALKEAIKPGSTASERHRKETHRLVQLYATSFIDNQPGSKVTVVSHTKRPMTGVCPRMRKKDGRMRNNLMGKRCDQTARAVITPDPLIGINELGVPVRIAMNQTFGEVVNEYNVAFLSELVANGPDKYPGATSVKRNRDGFTEMIALRVGGQPIAIELQPGDVVYRHLIDGDIILFNRQPSLHKMSLMGHRVRVMPHDTFRLNVCATTPYNADFDGDEMNTHNAQCVQTRSELNDLSSVPWLMVNPKNGKPSITPVQDCLLGLFRMSKDAVAIPRRVFMNLMMKVSRFGGQLPPPAGPHGRFTGRQATSVCLSPTTHLDSPNDVFGDDDDPGESPNFVVIRNGVHERGALTKRVFGNASRSLMHAAWEDEGPNAAVRLINDLQRLANAWLRTDGFSVGVSDLVPGADVDRVARENVDDMNRVIDAKIAALHLEGIDNHSTLTNHEYFEEIIKGVATSHDDATKAALMRELGDANRMMAPIRCKSKGDALNIQQMMTCVGQQQVDGTRIQADRNGRTMAHFACFDRSAAARGHVASSFIHGLRPTENFFHAIAGREGLIDTAVRTSETGYTQRQLIKALEDAQVMHDLTVRGSSRAIVQFLSGDDGMDPSYVEVQTVPQLAADTPAQLMARHLLTEADAAELRLCVTPEALKRQPADWADRCAKRFERLLQDRAFVATRVLGGVKDKTVKYPVPLERILRRATERARLQEGTGGRRMTDLTPAAVLEAGDRLAEELMVARRMPGNSLLGVLLRGYLCPKALVLRMRLRASHLAEVVDEIRSRFRMAFASPGDMVGIVAAQSIGETITQLTLNSFHTSGSQTAVKATQGVSRLKELLSCSRKPKTPFLTVYLQPDVGADQDKTTRVQRALETTRVRDLLVSSAIYFDPPVAHGAQGANGAQRMGTMIEADRALVERYDKTADLGGPACPAGALNPWLVRLVFDREKLYLHGLSLLDVALRVQDKLRVDGEAGARCVFSDDIDDALVMRVHANTDSDKDDPMAAIKALEEGVVNTAVKGLAGVERTAVSRRPFTRFDEFSSEWVTGEEYVIDTAGTNLRDALALNGVDSRRVISSNVIEINAVLGIEAARTALYNELSDLLKENPIAHRHLSLLVDIMTCRGTLMAINRHGINRSDSGPLAHASFEEVDAVLFKAALWGKVDAMTGISANIMVGQLPPCGTAVTEIVLDEERLAELWPAGATVNTSFDRVASSSTLPRRAARGAGYRLLDLPPPVGPPPPRAARAITYELPELDVLGRPKGPGAMSTEGSKAKKAKSSSSRTAKKT